MAALVETSLDGHVALCRLNRPEARNALSPEMMEELATALERYDSDPEVRCVVIAGSDEVFAAGADIKAMAERSFAEALHHPAAGFWRRLGAIKTPLVAAVSGWALGGGCELALACDMIVASETAELGQPEITLGIIPGGGGSQRLARVLGKQRAMELVLTGRRIDAAEAQRLGLVNSVAPKDAWLEAAMELAATVAARPPIATRLAKQAVLAADETALSAGMETERRLYELAMATEDRVEGMQAFLEKRKPEFRGALMANLHEPEFDPGRDWPQGYDGRFARVGAQAGAERLGATLYEVPPENALCPYHWHAGNEEMLIVLEGTATLRTPEGERELRAGDVVAFRVGEQGAHKVTNASEEPLRLLMVSEMNEPDVIAYPDSDKVMAREQAPGSEATGLRAVFRLADEVDYFEGETGGKAP